MALEFASEELQFQLDYKFPHVKIIPKRSQLASRFQLDYKFPHVKILPLQILNEKMFQLDYKFPHVKIKFTSY